MLSLAQPDTVQGPMAIAYDLIKGWTADKLGPKSGHWKCLAREGKGEKGKEGAGPTK